MFCSLPHILHANIILTYGFVKFSRYVKLDVLAELFVGVLSSLLELD